ncbi:MAG: 7TM diverse intracellular signaling domain-containing protein [Turneriella sp.]
MKKVISILTYFFIVSGLTASAFKIEDLQSGTLLGSRMEIYEDKAGNATLADVLIGKHKADFKTQGKSVPNFGSTQSTIYAFVDLTFPAVNRGHDVRAPIQYLLELSHPILDYVDFAIQDLKTGKILHSWKTGDLRAFNSRPINHRNFLFPIELPQQTNLSTEIDNKKVRYDASGTTTLRFVLKLNSESTMMIPLKFWAKKDFDESEAMVNGFLGFFYGLLVVMSLYNIIMASAFKSLSGYLYALYLFSAIPTIMAIDGLLYQLFPGMQYLANLGITFFGNLPWILVVIFQKQYLGITRAQRIKFYCLAVVAIYASVVIFVSVFAGYRVAVRTQFFLGILGPMLILYVAIQRAIEGYRPAIFFIIGYIILIIATVLFTLNRFGIIGGQNFLTQYSQHLGIALESILLSFGLADRIRLIQREKELAQATTIEQQRILNEAFARFVPTTFLEILGKKSIPEVILGDYTEREMTILFADIRSFTTISEKLTPKETFDFINNYLQGSGPVIRNNGGFIDKYMGDGIMALFENREDAIAAALRLQSRNSRLNRVLEGRLVAPLKVGIGIHTGHLMLGTIGEPQRMDGTVISDAVNLASRVESLTKQYGLDILVTKETLADMRLGTSERPWLRRFIDRIAVKGKTTPATLYEVFPAKEGTPQKYTVDWLQRWVNSLKIYYNRDFQTAVEQFHSLSVENPNDKVADIFVERCKFFIANPPAPNWNGVAIALNK